MKGTDVSITERSSKILIMEMMGFNHKMILLSFTARMK